MSQFKRICWIDAQIRAGQYPNAHTVGTEFAVSTRTGYGDRDFLLNEMNAPLKFDKCRGGWYYTDATFILPYLILTQGEIGALRKCLLVSQEYLPSETAQVLLRIASQFNLDFRTHFSHERASGSIHLTNRLSPELIQDVERAISFRHRLHIQYNSVRRGEINERVIHPYALLDWRGEVHIVAYCEWRQAIRQFFVGRIRQWKVLEPDCAFVRDSDFDLDDYRRRGFELYHGEAIQRVRLRFSEYQARWIRERCYHESQTIEELEGGGLVLTLEVAGLEEVRRWLLGYGGEVEVLEPESLREEMEAETKKLQEIYARKAECKNTAL